MTLALLILAATLLIGLLIVICLAVVTHHTWAGHEPTYEMEHGGDTEARRAWLDSLKEKPHD